MSAKLKQTKITVQKVVIYSQFLHLNPLLYCNKDNKKQNLNF